MTGGAQGQRVMQTALVLAVAAFAWLRFADNTVDNDTWGHVLYGERYWMNHNLRPVETLSWIAAGTRWMNHEYLADILSGLVHRAAGGTGLWLLMVLSAVATIGLALATAGGKTAAQRWTALLLFAASTNFIALGYGVRPQLFTMFALVVELLVLKKIAEGNSRWALLLPPLFALWANLHGGFLAGVVLLVMTVGITGLQTYWPRPLSAWLETTRLPRRSVLALVIALPFSLLALLLNPFGWEVIKWTLHSVLLARPQITEWQGTGFSTSHLVFYLVAAGSGWSWCVSRRPRQPWEAAILLLLAAMAIKSQRHLPLFGLANLILSAPHIADALKLLAPHSRSLIAAFRRPLMQYAAALALLAGGTVALASSLGPPKVHPFTIEVERNVYPVSALEFMRQHQLTGNTIVFFDWGQEMLWELPDNPVSFDGRFDTLYTREQIAAHFALIDGKALPPEAELARAEVALLPSGCGGVGLLMRAGWKILYIDPLAAVLAPAGGRHLAHWTGRMPVVGDVAAVQGRVPFPDQLPVLGTSAAQR